MIEEGYPGFDLSAWYGIVAPAGTPPEIVRRLNTEIVKILNMADVKDLLLKQGLDAAPSTPEEMAAEIKADIDKYARVLKAAGIEAK
jgi:tripartite-type tricarboxylate transporter receptor subunit TctC